MELMCIKHRHENGCMWPFEGYSPVLVVDVRHTRWVNSFSLFSFYLLSLSLSTIFDFAHATIHFAINRKILLSLFLQYTPHTIQILHIWLQYYCGHGTHEIKQISHHWICKDPFLFMNHRIKLSFPIIQADTSIVLVTQIHIRR